jgi:AraC-like DNA-binding protein
MDEYSLLLRNDVETPLGRIEVAGISEGVGKDHHKPMRVLGSYALVYLFEGGGFYRDANHYSQRLRGGDLLVLFPELGHAYGPGAGDSWGELYFVFNGPIFDLLRESGLLDASRPIHHYEPIEHWLGRLKSIVDHPRPTNESDSILEMNRLFGVVTELTAVNLSENTAAREPYWLYSARNLLGADLGDEMELESIASQVGMSYENFRKKFRKYTGISPSRYRAEKRIGAARSLLQHTQMTNEQIARTLGFKDPFHFSRRFKQITGLSPRTYRSHPT